MDTALSTKEKIVELGRSFIQQIGYHAFNYKQISSQLNIKNAAVHHYYPTKEDLGLAVIEKDRRDFEVMTKQVENATPMEKLEALLYNYDQYFNDNNKMCMIGTFCSSYNDVPQNIRIAATQYLNIVSKWLTNTLQEGLDRGDFKFEGTAEKMANLWGATLPGSLQIGRALGANYFNSVIDQLRKSVKAV
ncbi:TetR/AcrR family transcriptional regulator [Mucilaginibacter sabulilitoris]|uniref:TetR/AcrR family transcriptional regulator n=1 Tax=Mucilaginibacter sabulilitoris TaxID=1173583 RepID=A0ABZ0TQA2_9SPHI|nr:TetR/AcrR family transcriptional regulator [Mucilaginibacter sabulilitoris]WPU95321.1 TetR/AcrR family transcriptional regulator [Mucilaginibacter sabulilitoris]